MVALISLAVFDSHYSYYVKLAYSRSYTMYRTVPFPITLTNLIQPLAIHLAFVDLF